MSYRILSAMLLCGAFLFHLCMSSSGSSHESENQPFSIGRRFQCNSSMEIFNSLSIVGSDTLKDFYCQSMRLPQTFSVSLFQYFRKEKDVFKNMVLQGADGSGSLDVCANVTKWEQRLGVTCVDLLCGNSSVEMESHVKQLTQNETSLHDWINYCHYCTINNTMRFKENHLCKPKDELVSTLLDKIPLSVSFCGIEEFGIPFLVKRTQVPEISKLPEYLILCYCPARDVFGVRCNPMHQISIISAVVSVFVNMTHYTLSFLCVSFLVFIPKLVSCFRKKRFRNIYTSLFLTISLLLNSTSFLAASINGTERWTTFLYTLGVAFTVVSLFCWLISWYRIVQLARTRSEPRTFWMYGLLFFILAAITACYLAFALTMADIFDYFTLGTTCGVGLLVMLSFSLSSAWMHRAMKKITDVNVINTSVGSNICKILTWHSL